MILIGLTVLVIVLIIVLVLFMNNNNESTSPISVKDKPKTNTTKKNERNAIRKGDLGEFKVNFQLEQLPTEYKRIDDLLIRKSNGYTSQIDHVVISRYGIFVIETKNYMGKIYGNENSKKWMQINYGKKTQFFNPVWQNNGHVSALKQILKGHDKDIYKPVIVFSRRCELKGVTTKAKIIFDTEITNYITKQSKEILLSDNDVQNIYNTLLKANLTDKKSRQEHIGRIKQKNK